MSATLILGGARSGKSSRAEALATASDLPVVYVATSLRDDDDIEWQCRIEQHQQQRPNDWKLVEEPMCLSDLLQSGKYINDVLLIDCLTLWLSNMMLAEKDIRHEVQEFCKILSTYQGEVILVSNEVGMGLVPETTLGRAFRDEQGRLNQAVAKAASSVEFIAAGLPITLK